MLLKSYQRFRTIQMDYEELRDILEIKPEEYRPFGEFKRWVLERSRKEMMDKNDIYFDYEAIRATSSQKSDVAKIVFHIRNNPNHAEVFRQFQIKESKVKEPIILITNVAPTQTKGNQELSNSNLFEQLNTTFAFNDGPLVALNPKMTRLFRIFDTETPDNVLLLFINNLQKAGFSEERIMDVLFFAQECQLKGEKIRNIMGYVKHGLESGIMGIGLSKKKEEQGSIESENLLWNKLMKDSQFAEWQQQYYIKRGLNASNDVKIAFAEATRKISATAHYFEENGHVKESEKDKLRASLGKKITNTEGTNDEVLFIQWAFEIKGVHIEKNKNKWQEVKRQNV